jgi:hypothetical protein
MFINEIAYHHIQSLTPQRLTELLHNLLNFEATYYKMPHYKIYVPQKITRGDGGEDGMITCDNTNGSSWITNNNTIFQSKATNLTATNCAKEITIAPKKGQPNLVLKHQVEKVLDAGGKYVLFMKYHTGARSDLEDRIDVFYNTCQKIGKTYLRTQFDVFDGQMIADWVNNFEEMIVKIQEWNGIRRLGGMLSLENLGRYRKMNQIPFQTNASLSNFKDLIKSEILKPGSCIRVLGHAGIGKTRLVYEALKEIPNAKHSVLYFEANDKEESLLEFFIDNSINFRGILVIDNCNYKLHHKLKDELNKEGNQFSLITIDYEVEEYFIKEKSTGQSIIYIDNNSQRDIVYAILNVKYSKTLDPSLLKEIADYSDGYPLLAEWFVEANLNNKQSITKTTTSLDKEIKEKLIFGRDYSNVHDKISYLNIITSCAMFTHFGYPFGDITDLFGEAEYQRMLEQSKLIFSKVCSPPINQDTFSKCCEYFRKRGLLERSGNYYFVKPNPLAINLAADYIELLFDKEQFIILFKAISDSGLGPLFVERFKYLAHLGSAKRIAEKVYGTQSPFSTAEVLNTELGSRLFRSIVEVNPDATLATLSKVFLNMSTEELTKIKDGRRNLVWSLEKLCFRKETFSEASKILYAFAVAENETWSNNATGQFIQLFHTYLPGTEANYNDRIEIIKYGLSREDVNYIRIAIAAIIGAFHYHGVHRMLGAENQGNNLPLKDFYPKTNNDILDYWEKLMEILLQIFEKYPEFREDIQLKVARSLRSIISKGGINIVKYFINFLVNKKVFTAPDIRADLKLSLKYDNLNSSLHAEIEKILDNISPKSYKEKLITFVSQSNMETTKDDAGNLVNIAQKNAYVLAEEFVQNNIDIKEYLPLLLRDKQRNTFDYALRYGELLPSVNHNVELVKYAIGILRNIPKEAQNISFIIGILRRMPAVLQMQLIDEIKHDSILFPHAISLAKFFYRTSEEVISLFDLVENGQLQINDFLQLSNGDFVYELNFNELEKICNKFWEYDEVGKWIVLEIINNHSLSNPNNFLHFKFYLKERISIFNFGLSNSRPPGIDDYIWAEFLKKLLLDEKDEEFAIIISKQLCELFRSTTLISYHSYVTDLSSILVNEYFDLFWKEISEVLLEDGIGYFNVRHTLGADNGNFSTSDSLGLLFHNTKNYLKIFEWCENNCPKGVLRIASMMPIISTLQNSSSKWSDFAIQMIDSFYDLDGFLDEIIINLNNFGWVGSAVPYYEQNKQLFEELLTNTNPSVKKWAKNNIKMLDKDIRRGRIEDEERALGL